MGDFWADLGRPLYPFDALLHCLHHLFLVEQKAFNEQIRLITFKSSIDSKMDFLFNLFTDGYCWE